MYQKLDINPDGGERLVYNASDFPVRCVDGDLSGFYNFAAGCHWHNDFEFLMPQEGDIEYFVNGNTILVPQGNAIFINANRLHYGFSSAKQECLYDCLLFHPSIFGQTLMLREIPKLTSDTMPDFLMLTDYESLRLLHRITALYKEQPPFFEISVLASCCELMCLIYRQMDSAKQDVEPDAQWLALRQMIGFLQTNYANTIRLEDIAAAGTVCRSKCCQLFRDKMNTTPMTYLNRYRMEKAREMLLSADDSITEIAHRCGFDSPSYFSDMFRKMYKESPRTFQKRKNTK